jgi:hypothetical protein
MSLPITLLIIRIVGALLLLSFLGLLLWMMLKDLDTITSSSRRYRSMKGSLIVISSSHETIPSGTWMPLFRETTVGRAPDNTIILDDEYTSNEHAMIVLIDDQWWLEDMNSSNGTLLNNLPINKPTVITSGDLITIGETQFRAQL